MAHQVAPDEILLSMPFSSLEDEKLVKLVQVPYYTFHTEYKVNWQLRLVLGSGVLSVMLLLSACLTFQGLKIYKTDWMNCSLGGDRGCYILQLVLSLFIAAIEFAIVGGGLFALRYCVIKLSSKLADVYLHN